MKRILIFILISVNTFAQDPFFSQYNTQNQYLNPGLSGSNGAGKVGLGYRKQWPGLNATYTTFLSSYEQYLHKIRGGLGFNFLYDAAGNGMIKTFRPELIYAAHFELLNKKLILRPGISVAYATKKFYFGPIDHAAINSGQMYAISIPEKTTVSYFDISGGMVFNFGPFTGGYAIHHLNTPSEGLTTNYPLPAKHTFHFSGVFGSKEARGFSISPHVLYMKQSYATQLVPGITTKFSRLLIGAAYRDGDALIFQAGYVNSLFRIGYSYDLTISALAPSGGSHEVGMTFQLFNKKEKKVKPLRMIAF